METKDAGGEDRNAKTVRLVLGDELSEPDILRALSQCGSNPDAAINFILDTPGLFPAMTVKRTVTSTGARISPQIKQENGEGSEEVESADGLKPIARVKEEPDLRIRNNSLTWVKKSKPKMSFDEFLQATNTKVMADDLFKTQIKEENTNKSDEAESLSQSKGDVKVKEEFDLGIQKKVSVKEEVGDSESIFKEQLNLGFDKYCTSRMGPSSQTMQKPSCVEKGRVEDLRVSTVVIEDGDFPEETDWLLVGRTTITGLSTTKGRKLENNELVHFAFPSADKRSRYSSPWMGAKAAAASSGIVRFSTKRSGEIGRLPMEWAKCLVPLVNSSKVKVLGRCIAGPLNLQLMQEILLYVSLYIHHSVFTDVEKSSWRLDTPSNIDSTVYPLLPLFKLLKTKTISEG